MKKTNVLIKSIMLLSFFSILLIGCSFSTHFVQTGSRVYEETNPETVKIYSGEPQEEYIVIGSIAIDHAGNNNDNAMRYLQEKAALLGANAVIHTTLSSVRTNQESIGINGVAVKFKK
jgi:hypothetical protein